MMAVLFSVFMPMAALTSRLGKKGKIAREDFLNIDYSGAYFNEAIALQPDGKIVTVGYGPYRNTVLYRYHTDGTPDLQFGDSGMVVTKAGEAWDESMQSIAVQPDGKIVVGGYYGALRKGYVMKAMRYTPDGKLDPYFGAGGKVAVPFKGTIKRENCRALLQGNGSIILAGSVAVKNAKSKTDFALCRLHGDGTIDSSFGIDGRQVLTTMEVEEGLHNALLQPDGKIVLVGYSFASGDGTKAVLSRYYTGGVQPPLVATLGQQQRATTINWKGLDAENIAYYSIQHRTATGGFAEIGKRSGAGSSPMQEYGYPLATAGIYRIVAVDKTRRKTFSNTLLVQGSDLAAAPFLFPNPAKDYITIYGLNSNTSCTISLINGNGAVLSSQVSRGNSKYRIKVSHLPSGAYYLLIADGQKTTNLNFIKE